MMLESDSGKLDAGLDFIVSNDQIQSLTITTHESTQCENEIETSGPKWETDDGIFSLYFPF